MDVWMDGCMFVRPMYIYISTHICAYIYIHTLISINIYIYIYTYVYIYICVYVHVCVCMHMFEPCTGDRMCIHTYVCI